MNMNGGNKRLETLIDALDKCEYEVIRIEYNPEGVYGQIELSIAPTKPETD